MRNLRCLSRGSVLEIAAAIIPKISQESIGSFNENQTSQGPRYASEV